MVVAARPVARDATASLPAPTGRLRAVDLALTPAQLELQARARAFVRDELVPREVAFERAGGRVPRDWGMPIRQAAIAAGLQGGSFPRELGGQGWTTIEQVLVH